MVIKDYTLEGELRTDNSGFSKWGFASRNGRRYFIKEFISPVYPIYEELLEPELLRLKRESCDQYEKKCIQLYESINRCSDGTLVRIEEFFRYGSKYYIVTERLETAGWEAVTALPERERLRLCRVLLHSVGCLHRDGIVHGDIKMDNIMFKKLPSGHIAPKLIDFDASFRETEPPAPTEEIHGDLVYMAPETFQMMRTESGSIGTAVDVFALGLVIHQIMSGGLPEFNREAYRYPFEALLDGSSLKLSDHLPESIANILPGMLEADPEKRITLKEARCAAGWEGDTDRTKAGEQTVDGERREAEKADRSGAENEKGGGEIGREEDAQELIMTCGRKENGEKNSAPAKKSPYAAFQPLGDL